jgi:hypothetical protein
MALITEFVEPQTERRRVDPTTVTCDWLTFRSERGTVLQLSTGGSATRANPGKSSQKIQLDHAAALQLVSLIERAFPGILAEHVDRG